MAKVFCDQLYLLLSAYIYNMYTPKHYQEKDTERMLAFMQQYSFAIMVSIVGGRPWVTHVPFTIEHINGKVQLFTHIASANQQWKDLTAGQQVLVVFSGPHGFVSPKHYDSPQNVPTWDYIAVHVYGNVTIHHSREEKLYILNKMIAGFDPAYAEQFTKLSPNYLEAHLEGIVAISIDVTEMQGQFKLSQNKQAHEITRVIDHFSNDADGAANDLAKHMKGYPF